MEAQIQIQQMIDIDTDIRAQTHGDTKIGVTYRENTKVITLKP